MNGCDCSFWSISRLSSSSLVFCILGMWGGALLLAFCLYWVGPRPWDP